MQSIRNKSFLSWDGWALAVLIMFVLGTLGYGVFAGFPYSTAAREKDDINRLLRTLDRTLASLSDAEAGQRDFLISGDERFLDPYFAAVKKTDEQLLELTQFNSSNPDYLAAIKQLQQQKKTKFSELNDMVVLRRDQGFDAARAFVLFDFGKRHMDEMRSVIDRLVDEERTHLDRMSQAAARWEERRITSYLLAAAGVVLMGMILIFRREQLRNRLDIQILHEEKTELAERLQHVMERMPIGCFLFDTKSNVVYCNPLAERLLGVERQHLYNAPLPASGQILAWNEIMRRVHDGNVLGQITQYDESVIHHRDGSELICEWHYTPLLGRDSHIAGHLFMVADISERRAAEDRVRAHRQQLTALSRELITAQVDERKRIAQVLHDQLAQNLAAIKLMVDATLARASSTSDPALQAQAWAERMPSLLQLLSSSVTDVRDLLVELRPPMLEEFGVLASLRLEADRLRGLYGVNILFDSLLEDEIRLPAPTEHVCFLVLREALNNAAQHAKAGQISVRGEHSSSRSSYIVEDDGSGFDWVEARRKYGHLGLVGMIERASSIHAKLDIRTRKGHGTVIELNLEHAL